MAAETQYNQRHSKCCTSPAHCSTLHGYLWKHHKVFLLLLCLQGLCTAAVVTGYHVTGFNSTMYLCSAVQIFCWMNAYSPSCPILDWLVSDPTLLTRAGPSPWTQVPAATWPTYQRSIYVMENYLSN